MNSKGSDSTSSLHSWIRSRPTSLRVLATTGASLALLALVPAACENGDPSSGVAENDTTGQAAEAVVVPATLAVRRSLEVTDSIIMANFTLEAVMQQLLTQAGSTETPSQLFFQMFDTEQPATAPGAGSGPHCTGSFNGFPLQCPRLEGESGENLNPFIPDQTQPQTYKAVALANRFDLADPAGANCGQYRVVFARRSGSPAAGSAGGLSRDFIIFEAQLPNPNSSQGVLGCAPIAQFWQNLSEAGRTPTELASELHSFYFTGLPASGIGPVIHVDNYGGGSHGGQIRTNQFDSENAPIQAWALREFTLNHSCSATGTCSVVINPATVKVNPSATLFVPGLTDPTAMDFQAKILLNPTVLTSLATPTDINLLTYAAPDNYNTGESNSLFEGPPLPLPLPRMTAQRTDYLAAFGTGPSPLASQMTAELGNLHIPLTPVQIVNRIQSLSCAGCHNLSAEDGTLAGEGKHDDLGMAAPFPTNLETISGPDGGTVPFIFSFTHTSELQEMIPPSEGGDGTQTRFMTLLLSPTSSSHSGRPISRTSSPACQRAYPRPSPSRARGAPDTARSSTCRTPAPRPRARGMSTWTSTERP